MTVKTDSKGNELFRGERERDDGRYEYRYIDHKGKKHSVYGNRLQQLRLEEARIAFKEHKGLLYGLKELSLNNVFDMWLAGKGELKQNTIRGYKQIYDSHVRNGLGKKSIEDIKTQDVKLYYSYLKLERSLSAETICRIQNVLYQSFQYAYDSEIIWKNPALGATKEIRRNHPKRVSMRTGLNEAEADRLTDYILNTPKYRDWYPVVYILIHTGMRLGEVISLRWCDVNLEDKYLNVDHDVVYYAKPGERARYHASNGTKTIAGMRKIPFDEGVAEAFKMEREILAEKGIKCIQEIDGYTDFVFLNRNGKIFGQESINRELSRIVEEYNFSATEYDKDAQVLPHLTCHSLRHTYATILCERNVNIKVMQLLLGHKDISTTMDIYTRISSDFVFKEYMNKMKNATSQC